MLVLGEEGVAFSTSWFGDKVLSFDVASGSVNWTWEAASGQAELVAATYGGGLVVKDGSTIMQLGADGSPLPDPSTSFDPASCGLSGESYWSNGSWLGLIASSHPSCVQDSMSGAMAQATGTDAGLRGEVQAPLYAISISVWPLVEAKKQRQPRLPQMAHFVPMDPGGDIEPDRTVNWFRDQMLSAVPDSEAKHRFYLKRGVGNAKPATIENFLDELDKQNGALAFIGHSREYRDANLNLYSVGLVFADPYSEVLTPYLIKTPQPGDPYYGTSPELGATYVRGLKSQAKVIFIAACALTDIFKRFVDINDSTKGRALIVSTTPEAYLVTASVFWSFVAEDLANGHTVGYAVDRATEWFHAHPPLYGGQPSYVIIGDGARNVRIIQQPSSPD